MGNYKKQNEEIRSRMTPLLTAEQKAKFESFNSFVNDYYDTDSHGAGWEHVIKIHENDEGQAFKKFYELFDMFINI